MHNILNLKKNTIVGIIGDIHEHHIQFDNIINKFKPGPDRILISVGDLYDKGPGKDKAEYITNKIKDLNKNGYGYIVQGNHELKHIRRAIANGKISKELNWLNKQPYSLTCNFYNGKKITVVHGGVTPKHTEKDLSNSEVAYVRNVDSEGNAIPIKVKKINGKVTVIQKTPGKPWHEYYDGRFGFIVAGHEPQEDGIHKIYKYSANIDTACYKTGILTCMVIDDYGIKEIING